MLSIPNEKDISSDLINEISQCTGIDKICARILVSRGVDSVGEAKKFLYGNLEDLALPFEYTGVSQAVELIKKVISENGKIVIYGDYDCDGIGAVSILTLAFRKKAIKNFHYIPNRTDEGYGLNKGAIKKIKELYEPKLLITVDCGINAISEVEYAKELGMKVIVTDHHRAGELLPSCIVVNPCLNSNLTQLCGAGVAFTLTRALFGDSYAFEFLDICALSTVADIVPLTGDNRIIVKFGLEKIRAGKARTGIRELLFNAGIIAKQINSYDIAFKLAPRLNAAGRLSDAETSVKLLTTEDMTEARFIAEELDLKNSERQDIGNRIVEDVFNRLKDYDFGKYKIIVAYNPDWQEGVIGISAAKITEYFNLPTILLTDNSDGGLKGSARSIGGVNIFELLCSQKDKLKKFGGHAMAAGLSLEKENLDLFREGLNNEILKLPSELFRRKTKFDAVLPIEKLTDKLFKDIMLLEPFGFKNPSLVFYDDEPQIKFSLLKQRHLKAKTSFGSAVCFGKCGYLSAYESAKSKGIFYTPEKNYFNGNEYNQIKVKNLFFDDFHISNEESFKNFAEFSIAVKDMRNEKISQKSGSGIKIDVFFEAESYESFCKDKPTVSKIFSYADDFNLTDAAILSPKSDFPFWYYNKIIVHGEVTDDIRQYFSDLRAEFVPDKSIETVAFNLEEMRNFYKTLRSVFGKRDISSSDEAYLSIRNNGCDIDYGKFLAYYYIMTDVGLLKKENGDILKINNIKTDLTKSAIYRYINGRHA